MNENNHILWPTEVSLGDVYYPPGGGFGPRKQPYLQLVFLHSGHMTVWIDKVAHDAGPNMVFLLYPGHEELFRFAEHEVTYHSWLHADIPDLAPELATRLASIPRPLPLTPTMLQLLHSALALQPASLSTTTELLKTLAMQMFWLYIGEGERHVRYGHVLAHSTVEEARLYIHAHLSDPLTLEQIAQEVSISPSYLIRLFQTHLQATPISYLWQARVAHGISLLQKTGLSVQAIAEQCGFQTRHHFSRRVRQELGYGPQEVRNRSWLR
ncbi:AraC family transcriptional regulator [Ktedonospora formicarum]|nr:AraC family transcriptional regulator [Ktedonospora formicarum]